MAHTTETAQQWYEQETRAGYKAFLGSALAELGKERFIPYEKFQEKSVTVYSLATRNGVRQLAVDAGEVVGVQIVSITSKPFNMLKSVNDVMVFPRGKGYGAILSRAGRHLLQGWSSKNGLPIVHEAIDNNAAKIRTLLEKGGRDRAIADVLELERKRWKKLTPSSSTAFYPDEEYHESVTPQDFTKEEVITLIETTLKRL